MRKFIEHVVVSGGFMLGANLDLAKAFEKIATFLELEDANPFRIRAYRNAARTLNEINRPIKDLLRENVDLTTYPGIGDDLSNKIILFVKTGHIPLLDELSKRHPNDISELMGIDNLGPKRIKKLHEELGISSLEELKKAAEEKKIRNLVGFGEKTESKILERLKALTKINSERRILLVECDQISSHLVSYLEKCEDIKKIEVAGSARRRKETVGDVDIVVTGENFKKIIDYFTSYNNVSSIISKGTTRSSVILSSGLQVDLRVFKEESFGAGLYYLTGSKSHNIEVRTIAKKMGMKINEYGVYKGKVNIASKTEADIFKVMNLDFIPPELRENRGEILAASGHRLPKLVALSDLKGDLHTHTSSTDGRNTILEMAQKAKELGYQYIAITDHSKKVRIARGLDVPRLKKYIDDIDEANEKVSGIKILKGIEVDILEDGTLDLPDSVLSLLDIRVCSIHYQLKMNKRDMTERLMRAMDNPYFNILGHPTGRLIFKRAHSEFDFEKIIKAGVERGKFFEINSQPARLDLSSENCQIACELGAKFAISSDAHSTAELELINYGTDTARRGWVEKKNVINSLEWSELKKLIGGK